MKAHAWTIELAADWFPRADAATFPCQLALFQIVFHSRLMAICPEIPDFVFIIIINIHSFYYTGKFYCTLRSGGHGRIMQLSRVIFDFF